MNLKKTVIILTNYYNDYEEIQLIMDSVPKDIINCISSNFDSESLLQFAKCNTRMFNICKLKLQTYKNMKIFENPATSGWIVRNFNLITSDQVEIFE